MAVPAEWRMAASCIQSDGENGGPYAYRIELMASQIRVLFGCEAKDLEEFSFLSQISQAEAKKYFIDVFGLENGRERESSGGMCSTAVRSFRMR